MIAQLIDKNNKYICSECRIKQPNDLSPFCYFCGANFSNYEEILIKQFLKDKDESIKESYNAINE